MATKAIAIVANEAAVYNSVGAATEVRAIVATGAAVMNTNFRGKSHCCNWSSFLEFCRSSCRGRSHCCNGWERLLRVSLQPVLGEKVANGAGALTRAGAQADV